MPGQDIEVRGALDEGVVFMHAWGPDSDACVERRPGRRDEAQDECSALAFDEQGRLGSPFSDETMRRAVRDGHLRHRPGAADGFPGGLRRAIRRSSAGPLVDLTTGESSVPGLFLAGDVATGPKTIIIAIGQAHETAISVHRYLQGLDLTADRRPPVHPPEYYLQKMYAPSPDEVVGDGGPGGRRVAHARVGPRRPGVALGTQVELGWPKGDGHREAVRCMRCQTHVCVACTMCARVCPDNCIAVEGDDTGYVRSVDPVRLRHGVVLLLRSLSGHLPHPDLSRWPRASTMPAPRARRSSTIARQCCGRSTARRCSRTRMVCRSTACFFRPAATHENRRGSPERAPPCPPDDYVHPRGESGAGGKTSTAAT